MDLHSRMRLSLYNADQSHIPVYPIRAWIVEAFGAEYSSLSSEAIHGDMALLVLPRPGNATFSCDGGRSQDLVVTRTDPGISLVWTNSF